MFNSFCCYSWQDCRQSKRQNPHSWLSCLPNHRHGRLLLCDLPYWVACLLPVSFLSWLYDGNYSCDAKLRKQTLSKKCERYGLCGYWYLELSRIHFVFANLQCPCLIWPVYGIRYCRYYRFGMAHFLSRNDHVGQIWIGSGGSWRWGRRLRWRVTRSWCWQRWLCWHSSARLR